MLDSQVGMVGSPVGMVDSQLPVVGSLVPVPDSLMLVPDSLVPVVDSQVPVVGSQVPVLDSQDSLVPVLDSQVPVVDRQVRVPIAGSGSQRHWPVPSSFFYVACSNKYRNLPDYRERSRLLSLQNRSAMVIYRLLRSSQFPLIWVSSRYISRLGNTASLAGTPLKVSIRSHRSIS